MQTILPEDGTSTGQWCRVSFPGWDQFCLDPELDLQSVDAFLQTPKICANIVPQRLLAERNSKLGNLRCGKSPRSLRESPWRQRASFFRLCASPTVSLHDCFPQLRCFPENTSMEKSDLSRTVRELDDLCNYLVIKRPLQWKNEFHLWC